MIRVSINGFGRIGRGFMRAAVQNSDIEVVAINDLGDLENLVYLLKYDTVYGKAPFTVEAANGSIIINGKNVSFLQVKDPLSLPWKDLDIDVVVESTGIFDSFEKASAHKAAGAKHVVISAPVKDEMVGGATVLMGVNEEKLATCDITSNASCTTNASSPIIAILNNAVGIEKALLNTTHAYTATQSIVDSPVKGSDYRRGRAAAQNMCPSSTGAAIAVTKAYPELVGKFDGVAVRVPVAAGSIADITFVAKRDTTVDEINKILEDAAITEAWSSVFATTREQLVSSDIVGDPHGSIADLTMTRVVGGNLVKVMAWYDNEMGYIHTLIEHVAKTGRYIYEK